jgi:phosphatidylinositol-3-phosphatase
MQKNAFRRRHAAFAAFVFLAFASCRTENNSDDLEGYPPAFSKIVVVIGENERSGVVYGNTADAPYINSLANSGAMFTSSFGIQHPSQPNYLCLLSGSNQNINDNFKPSAHLTTANLAHELFKKGKTFACFSEGLPYTGSDDTISGLYVRRHNPVANWTGAGENQVPFSFNRPFTDFPTGFAQLPDVSFVIPNLCNDGHDVCPPFNNRTRQFDHWVEANLSAYAGWCINNNSLLIITYDEDDWSADNRIATVFYGAAVKKGTYSNTINHYTVLRTIEDAMRLSKHAGNAATQNAIDYCWE